MNDIPTRPMRWKIGSWLVRCGLRIALGSRGQYASVVINGREVSS